MQKSAIILALGVSAILCANDPYYPSTQAQGARNNNGSINGNGNCAGGNCNINGRSASNNGYYQGPNPEARPTPNGNGNGNGGCPHCDHRNAAPFQHEVPYRRTANPLPDLVFLDQFGPSDCLIAYANTSRPQKANTDSRIAKTVHDLISSEPFPAKYHDVLFEVNNGAVTLKGTIETGEDRKKLEDQVSKISGVKQVDNLILVRGTPEYKYYDPDTNSTTPAKTASPSDYAATDNDKRINEKIRAKIDEQLPDNSSTIVIKTLYGVVTLSGSVTDKADIQKISNELKKIEGIAKINNQLIVRKSDQK